MNDEIINEVEEQVTEAEAVEQTAIEQIVISPLFEELKKSFEVFQNLKGKNAFEVTGPAGNGKTTEVVEVVKNSGANWTIIGRMPPLQFYKKIRDINHNITDTPMYVIIDDSNSLIQDKHNQEMFLSLTDDKDERFITYKGGKIADDDKETFKDDYDENDNLKIKADFKTILISNGGLFPKNIESRLYKFYYNITEAEKMEKAGKILRLKHQATEEQKDIILKHIENQYYTFRDLEELLVRLRLGYDIEEVKLQPDEQRGDEYEEIKDILQNSDTVEAAYEEFNKKKGTNTKRANFYNICKKNGIYKPSLFIKKAECQENVIDTPNPQIQAVEPLSSQNSESVNVSMEIDTQPIQAEQTPVMVEQPQPTDKYEAEMR